MAKNRNRNPLAGAFHTRSKTTPKGTNDKAGFAGFDNPRENIDPQIKTKVVYANELVVDNNAIFSNTKNQLPQILINNSQEQFAININSTRTDDTIMIINSKMTALHSSFKVRGTATSEQQGSMIGSFQEFEDSTGQCFFAGQWGLGHGMQISMTNTNNTSKGLRIDNSAGVNADFVQFNSSAGEKFSVDKDGVPATAGSPGVSGTFTTTDGKTVTVTNGIITSIV